MVKKAKKRFFWGKTVKKWYKMLRNPRVYSNFSFYVEWRKSRVDQTLRCGDMGSRNAEGQNLALCQINKFYAKKYFPGLIFAIEFIFDTLVVRWTT